MATLIADTFTAADGTDIAGRTPDTTTGGATWSERVGNWQITGNAAASPGTNRSHCTIDSGQADCVITVEANSNTASSGVQGDCGVIARWSSIDNYWSIGINAQGDTFRIVERNATVETTRATTSVTVNTATYYTIQVTLSGASISATLEGGSGTSYGSATFQQTATVHGFRGQNASDRIDDFLAESADGATEQPIQARRRGSTLLMGVQRIGRGW